MWELTGRRMGEALLAPPSVVLPTLVEMLQDGSLLTTAAGSLRQMFLGYLLACIVGMPLGVAMGRSRHVEVLLFPWLSMLIVTSVASLMPLFILGFGTGFQFRLMVVFAASVFYVTLVTYQGARDVERRWIDVGRSFSATGLQRFRKIILPALFPYLLAAARIGLGQALRGMVIAELFVIVGIGGLIHNAGLLVSTSTMLALLFVLMVIAMVANELLREATRRLAPWYERRATS
ncbi:MAG: ABC transporter permease [Geminicoccaceae bacterium]